MKTITLPTATRSNYLIHTLSSLKDNDLTGYKLYINCEPYEDVINVVNKIDWIETDIKVNTIRLGVRGNPYNLISRTFESGSKFNVHIEDDLILSPDFIKLANFYYEMFKDNPLTYMNYGMFNQESEDDEPSAIHVTNKWIGLGWSTFKENWYEWYNPYWFNDDINKQIWGPYTVGWDWSMHSVAKMYNLKSLQPDLSRSNHLGREGGTYCSASFHDQSFVGLKINTDTDIEHYYIKD